MSNKTQPLNRHFASALQVVSPQSVSAAAEAHLRSKASLQEVLLWVHFIATKKIRPWKMLPVTTCSGTLYVDSVRWDCD